MSQTLVEYLKETFSGELTNGLFIGIIFILVIEELKKYFPIDLVIKKLKLKSTFIKLIITFIYFIPLLVFGFIGVFIVVTILWLVSHFLN